MVLHIRIAHHVFAKIPVSLTMMLFSLNQHSQKLAGTVNWGTATVIGVFAGLFYGGSKEASASVVSLYCIKITMLQVLVLMFCSDS